MEVHAYPTEATVPVDLAEAQRIADLHLSDPDDIAAGIRNVVTEFDGGFIVIAVVGAATEAPVPPPAIGGSVCVIDKSTGAVSFWPSYPTTLVAEQYTEMLNSGSLVVEDEWPDPDADDADDLVDWSRNTDEATVDYGGAPS
ncbi:hypothetical protein [Nocardia sp. NPDC050710]|uniref:hypothetical protein n=1 Tax=Nocardia sp. NPDC050710 TaxID=3157220 RepID=UPI0033E30AEE